MTHQGIAFDLNSELLDGQHRLAAIVRAKQSVTLMVTYNADRDTYTVLDQGQRRSASDAIHRSRHVVSVMRGLLSLEAGLDFSSETLRTRDAEQEHGRLGSEVDSVTRIQGISTAAQAALIFAARKYPQKVAEFSALLRSGAMLGPNHPALRLRDRLLKSKGRGRDLQKEEATLTFTALRAFIEGRTLSKMYLAETAREFFLTGKP